MLGKINFFLDFTLKEEIIAANPTKPTNEKVIIIRRGNVMKSIESKFFKGYIKKIATNKRRFTLNKRRYISLSKFFMNL